MDPSQDCASGRKGEIDAKLLPLRSKSPFVLPVISTTPERGVATDG